MNNLANDVRTIDSDINNPLSAENYGMVSPVYTLIILIMMILMMIILIIIMIIIKRMTPMMMLLLVIN